VEFPQEFNARSYRRRYPDLAGLTRAEVREHWQRDGRPNGRNGSQVERREQLLSCLSESEHLLEIGPFDNPSLEAIRTADQEIDYADYLSQEELVARAREIPGRESNRVPPIRYVLSRGGYQQIQQRYDAIVSHHCVEHQPDLITHLKDVAGLLKPHGVYLCTLPDQRRCFDRYLPRTSLVEVIAAHLEKRTRPPLQAVIEHRCFTVQDWQNSTNPMASLQPGLSKQLELAFKEFQSQPYVDVHCWKFTSTQFSRILSQIVTLGFLPQETHWHTYNLDNEFAVIIRFDSALKQQASQ